METQNKTRLGLSLRLRIVLMVATTAIVFTTVGIWLLRGLDDALALNAGTEAEYARLDKTTGQLLRTAAERHELLSQMRMAAADKNDDRLMMLRGRASGLRAIHQKNTDKYVAALPLTSDQAAEAQDALQRQMAIYNAAAAVYTDSLTDGRISFADKQLAGVISPAYIQVQEQLQVLRNLQKAQMLELTATRTDEVVAQRTWGIVFTVLGGLLLMLLPILLFSRSLRSLLQIHPVLDRLQRGEIASEKLPETGDEVGRIARGINTVSQNLERAASFAHDVGQNKFDTEFEVSGENDLLGSALVDMRDRLKRVAEDEARRNWTIKGMAQFGEILRANQDLTTFADQICQHLTRYIGGIQGAFFLLQDGAAGKPELTLIGCYAYDRKKYIDRTFQLGEGLVGQAALERGTIYLTEVPQGYVSITSGLGQANPDALLVVPLLANNELLGVLEFAGFQRFEQHVIEFVEKLAENIASTLTHVKNNERNQDLLRETQRMAENLRANEEELRQNMEELQATHEEMHRLQQEMQGQLAAISRSNAVVEFDMTGRILTANDQFLSLMGYTLDEIRDKHHSLFVQPDEAASAEYREFWNRLQMGQFIVGEFERVSRRGTSLHILGSYNPILNAEGKPYKIIKFATDITESKNKDLEIQKALEQSQAQEEELRQNAEEMQATQEEVARIQAELQGQMDAINRSNAVIEFDTNGNILSANANFLRVMSYTLDELKGKHHSLFMDPREASEPEYAEHWQRLRDGEFLAGEYRRLAHGGREVWIQGSYNPVFGKDGRVYKVVKIAQDITMAKQQQEQIRQTLEEVQAQEEELRQNAEEMAATQEEMKRIQAELEGQMKAINRSNAVIEFDLRGNILHANANFLRLMGYTLEEVTGRHHSMFMGSAEANTPAYTQHWIDLAAGELKSGEFRRITKDGSEVWIQGSYNPIFNKDGVVYKVIKFAQDITLGKQQQEQVRQMLEEAQAQEEELRQNAEEMAAQQEEMARVQIELKGQVGVLNAAALVSEADVKGDIIYCNDTFCKVAKYTREELMGNNHRMLKSGHQPQEIFENMWHTISSGGTFQAEIKNRAKDGTYYWVAATIAPVLGPDGKPVKYIGVRFDITEQKNQQEQVRQMLEEAQAQEEELRQNAEEMAAQQEEMGRVQVELKGQVGVLNAAALVSEADIKGDIIYCNDTFCKVAKYTREELMGNNHRMLKSGHQPQEIFENMWRTISSGGTFQAEIKNRAKDGSYYWVAATIAPVLGPDGKPVKYIGVRFDITEQRNQQEQVRQMLEEAQAQEEELRQNAEEMAAQQEEMARVQMELRGQVGVLNSAALVSETDIAGNIIYCNDTFCTVAKYTREELLGNNHRMLKSGHQPQEIFENLWRTVSSGGTFQAEIKNRAKDGSYYWVAATIAPVLGTDGKPVKYVGVRFDITEQRNQQEQVRQMLEETQAQEEELRQNTEEMAATQEEMARLQAELKGQLDAINRSNAVVEFDTRGQLLNANQNFLSLMGYKLGDIQGRHHRMFVDNSYSLSQEYKDFWQRLQNGEFISGEFRRVGKDGQTVWIRGSYNPVFNADGVLYKVVKFAQDITEAKMHDLQVEEKLAEARMREDALRSQLGSQRDYQGLIEIQGGKISTANARLLQAMGYQHPQEVVGKELAQLTEDSALYEQLMSAQNQQREFVLIAKNGERMQMHGLFNAVEDNGKSKVIGLLHLD